MALSRGPDMIGSMSREMMYGDTQHTYKEVLARKIVRRSKSMVIHNGELLRCSISGVFQRCVSPEEGQEILREIHEGDCGHHAGSKSLVAKAFCHGFYCLTANSDAVDVRTPTQCHIDLACNTSNHFAASRTVFPRVSPYLCPGPFAPFGIRI